MTQVINGTLDPTWNAELMFDVIDADNLILRCYDEDVGSDDLIGTATVSLTEVFQSGLSDSWVPLSFSSKKGDSPAGDLHLKLAFWGPPSISFPQRPSSMQTSYDDENRANKGPIPPTTPPFVDTEETAKLLSAPGVMDSSGIISVTVVEGTNLKGSDSKLFAYVRCKVGPVKKAKACKTKNVKVSSSGSADWSNEAVEIPISELFKLEEDGDVNLTVDLMDDNTFSDTVLVSTTIKLKEHYLSKPGIPIEATYEMKNGKVSPMCESVRFYFRANPFIDIRTRPNLNQSRCKIGSGIRYAKGILPKVHERSSLADFVRRQEPRKSVRYVFIRQQDGSLCLLRSRKAQGAQSNHQQWGKSPQLQ